MGTRRWRYALFLLGFGFEKTVAVATIRARLMYTRALVHQQCDQQQQRGFRAREHATHRPLRECTPAVRHYIAMWGLCVLVWVWWCVDE